MNRWLALTWCLLTPPLSGGAATTTDPECVLSLAFLAEAEGNGQELVLDTYRQLFGRLGQGRIPPAVLRSMENPFELKEDTAGEDFFTLSRSLKRLEELVRAKGWDSPGLRSQLRNELVTMAALGERAAEAQTATLTNEPKLIEIPIGTDRVPLFSPDQRWMIALNPGPTKDSRVIKVYDTKENKVSLVPVPDDYPAVPLFIIGNKVALFQEGLNVETVAFNEGTFDWTTRKYQFSSTLPLDDMKFYSTNSPDLFFIPAWGQLYRSDLNHSDKFLPLSFPEPAPVHFGVLPGSSNPYWVAPVKGEFFLFQGATTVKGKVVNSTAEAVWPMDPGQIHFSADRRSLVSSPPSKKDSIIVQTWKAKAQPIFLVSAKTKTTSFGGEFLGLAASPVKNEGYLLVRGAGPHLMRIEKVNFKTKECVWSHELTRSFPEDTGEVPYVSGDGSKLMFRDRNRNLVVVDLTLIESMVGK